MDSNTHSAEQSARKPAWESAGAAAGHGDGQPAGRPDGLATLAAAVDGLAAQDRHGLSDGVRAQRVLELRRLLDRLAGHWLAHLAGVDGRGGHPGTVAVGGAAGWPGRWVRRRAGGWPVTGWPSGSWSPATPPARPRSRRPARPPPPWPTATTRTATPTTPKRARPGGHHGPCPSRPGRGGPDPTDHQPDGGLAARLQAAMALLPPILGGPAEAAVGPGS